MASPSSQIGEQAARDRRERLAFYGDDGRGSHWLFFAGTIVGLAGIMRIVDAIWAFGYNGALPDGLKDGVLGSNLEHYAWLWLIVGVVLLISSLLIVLRSQLGRWVGLIAAAVMAVSAMAWMPYYPVWSLTYVGMAVLTFYALASTAAPKRPDSDSTDAEGDMTATQEGVSDQEAIVRAAVANLVGHSAFDARDVEATVRRLVAEWLELARVKTFVGIIAERHARMELSRLWSNTNRGPEPDAAATENS